MRREGQGTGMRLSRRPEKPLSAGPMAWGGRRRHVASSVGSPLCYATIASPTS